MLPILNGRTIGLYINLPLFMFVIPFCAIVINLKADSLESFCGLPKSSQLLMLNRGEVGCFGCMYACKKTGNKAGI